MLIVKMGVIFIVLLSCLILLGEKKGKIVIAQISATSHTCIIKQVVMGVKNHSIKVENDSTEFAKRCSDPYLLLNNADGFFKVPLSRISYCTSYNSSTQFNITGIAPIVVSRPIIYYEGILFNHGFIRIHHSTLVNIAFFCHSSKGEDTNEITLTTKEKLTVSRSRKKHVLDILRKWSVEG